MNIPSTSKPFASPQPSHYLVPGQVAGEEKNLEFAVSAADIDDAEDLFVAAKELLWDVNKWGLAFAGDKFQFRLTGHGQLLKRRARKGDHICIGAGKGTGEEYDWFIVEALEYDDYPDDNRETFAIHLRPVSHPSMAETTVQLQNTENASSTLVIERDHKILKALYHGRNEITIGEASGATMENVADKGVAAWLGLSDEQLMCLLKWFMGLK